MALFFAFFQVAYHFLQAILLAIGPFTMPIPAQIGNHVVDALGYGILTAIFCYVLYDVYSKK